MRGHDRGLILVLRPHQEGGSPDGSNGRQHPEVVNLSFAAQHEALACFQNAGQFVGPGPLNSLSRCGPLQSGVGASPCRAQVTQRDKQQRRDDDGPNDDRNGHE